MQVTALTFRSGPNRRGLTINAMTLVALCLAYFMVILDATIVNPALPALGADLHAGVPALQWVVNGYTLVFAACLLLGGALGDRVGARRTFLAGTGLFAAASLLCGLAPSVAAVVATRVAQGLGAALAVPASLALLRSSIDDPARRARAVGVWGAIGGIGAVTGSIAGGLLTGAVGWRAVFAVNVPIGLAAIALALRHVAPAPRPARPRRVDVPGQVLSFLALGALSFGLIEAGSGTWTDPVVIGALAVGVAAATAFVIVERRSDEPMLPPTLFASRDFSAANAIGVLANLGLYGQLFVINLFFQHRLGYSPVQAGLAILPEASLLSVSSVMSSRMTARRGPRPATVIGLAVGSVGLALLAAAVGQHSYALLAGPLAMVGFGMAFVMPAVTTTVVESVPAEQAGLASGAINTSRQIGSVVGVALLGSVGGLSVALAVAAAAFALGLVISLTTLVRPTRVAFAPS
jgi:MFS transporter, DHA2 family, methylenomycin A resistance protein